MTGRDCMDLFLNNGKPERLPAIEWASWWRLTMDRWRTEGLDPNWNAEDIKRSFPLDFDRQFWFIINPGPEAPKFKDNAFISTEEEYEQLRPFLYTKQAVYDVLPELDAIHERNEKNGEISWFSIEGFFWFPRRLLGIEEHLYSFYDEPELYHRICEDLTEYYEFAIEEFSQHFSPQFMTIAEDMSYNLGPMISETLFNEFLTPYYNRIIPLLKSKHMKVFMDSDGDVTKMIPWMKNAGFEGVLPLERQAGVDINYLTKQYPDFYFIGGFNKMVMKLGREAMEAEFQRLLPAIRRGHYLPSVDHQTPPDVSLETYRVYLELLQHYCRLAVSE